MIWYTLYSRKEPHCPWCDKARELLQIYGLNYYEYDLEDDGVKQMFSEQGYKTVPQVFINDGKTNKNIGGYNALERYLQDVQKEAQRTRNPNCG